MLSISYCLCFSLLTVTAPFHEFHDNTNHGATTVVNHGSTMVVEPWFIYHGTKLCHGKSLYYGKLTKVVPWLNHGNQPG